MQSSHHKLQNQRSGNTAMSGYHYQQSNSRYACHSNDDYSFIEHNRWENNAKATQRTVEFQWVTVILKIWRIIFGNQ